jgi:hypothetical protein
VHANGAWPSGNGLAREPLSEQVARLPEDRLHKALAIWEGLSESGTRFAPLLKSYLNARGIKEVPATARATMPPEYLGREDREQAMSHDPGMVLPVRNEQGEFQGIHVVWLNADMTAKCETGPQRQSYGLIKGNFVQLMDWDNPPNTLLIGEGAETTLAAMQVTGLPGIASAGAGMMQHLDPPRCGRYIILADNGDTGQQAASALASRLLTQFPERAVHIATPDRPEGSKPGYDWNDALMDAKGDPAKIKQLARAIIEAPTFEQVMTAEEKREVRINALARVMLDDPLSYDLHRTQAAKDLGLRVGTLDQEVERRCKILREEQGRERAKPTPVNMELLKASARDIIACEDVLEMFANDCSRMIAGEKVNLKMLLLSGTSRLFEHKAAINVALKGPSGGGKSETREEAVKFFPPEDVIIFTSLSPSALLYHEEDFAHKILSMGEAQDREQIAFQDLLLRQLMSEGKLRHLVVQKVANNLATVAVEKNGPVVFWLTTTRNKLHPENETRLTSLEIDDSKEQTARVVDKVAVVEGWNQGGLPDTFYKRWQDHQRWLKAGEIRVRIPYARTLARLVGKTDLANAPRFRRDFGQFLRAIKAHALLHRAHRRNNEGGEILADIAHDYAGVRTLMKDLLATAAELKVRQEILQTMDAVKEVCAENTGNRDRCAEMPDNDPEDGEATVRQVAEVLKLDRTAAYRRLRAAEHLELVVNLETREKRPGRYRATGQELIAVTDMLPTPDALRQAHLKALREKRLATGTCLADRSKDHATAQQWRLMP